MRSRWGSSPGGSRAWPVRAFPWTLPATERARLRAILAAVTSRAAGADWHDIPTTVRNLYPDDVRAVVGYGSWYADGLRKPSSFADTYVVVDDYARFHCNAFHAWMNRTLPPNVYFIWGHGETHREIQGKYNVISAADLERECSPRLRDVYNAGRLTKLVWLAWTRDGATRDWLIERLVDAHCTLTPVALALLPERFDTDDFSLELLGLSYRGEPRLEGWERVRALRAVGAESYRELHAALLAGFSAATGMLEAVPGGFRRCAGPRWAQLTRLSHRLLRRSRWRGYLRWPRIVLTEPHLVDLAVNEAERKAGVRIKITPELRRHPFIFGWPEFRRVLRERNTRERIGWIRRHTPWRAGATEDDRQAR